MYENSHKDGSIVYGNQSFFHQNSSSCKHILFPYHFIVPTIYFIILTVVFIPVSSSAQLSFEILSLEGSAKVQRSQKRTWEKVQVGQKINDNDLVETFFQTKLIVRFGEQNLIILGSNSKALMNIAPSEKENISSVNLTLFSGGLFSKVISKSHVSIYTANAVGEIDSGSISAVAESKSGETGFQLLGGSAFVRNIAQQEGRTLRAGLTTMILPNREPTAPLYITHRHVAVLKHFFGDDYITMELEASGIKPTDEQSGQVSFARGLSTQGARYSDEGIHRSLFSLNTIYGTIINDRIRNSTFYTPIHFPSALYSNNGRLHLESGFALTSDGLRSQYKLSSSYKLGKILDVGLRFGLAQNTESVIQPGFNSLPGLLDKVDHVTVGRPEDSLFLSLGTIERYTLGYGLIVDNYTNSNRNSTYQSLGANGQINLFNLLKIKAFTSDVTLPLTGGIYLGFEPSVYHFGAGYFFDMNQFRHNLPDDAFRFSSLQLTENTFPDKNDLFSNAHIYNVNFGISLVSYYNFNLSLQLEFAQKILNGNDGFVTRLPYFLVDIERFSFGGGFVVQSGRLLSGLFNENYHENRLHIKSGNFVDDTLVTLTNQLSSNRRASGIHLTFNTNPFRGIDVQVTWQQDFANKYSTVFPSDTSKGEDAAGDFSLHLSGRVNDSLVRFIKFGELYFSQNHGMTIPYKGSFFRSWDFKAGFFVLTTPLLFNLAFELGGTMFYFDMDSEPNNSVESTDFIFELAAGVRWGFR